LQVQDSGSIWFLTLSRRPFPYVNSFVTIVVTL
jgi:hypothetical protein